jgi:hypothetical protein
MDSLFPGFGEVADGRPNGDGGGFGLSSYRRTFDSQAELGN